MSTSKFTSTQKVADPLLKDGSKTLIIALHAYTATPDRLNSMRSFLKSLLPNATIEVPPLRIPPLSVRNPDDIATEVTHIIDNSWQSAKKKMKVDIPFNHIILIGHSTGGLIARKVYINACGFNIDRADEIESGQQPLQWAPFVDRIILLAALNRGWALGTHLPLKRYLKFSFGIGVARVLSLIPGLPKFLAFHTRKGSRFITNLRLQWIAMHHNSIQTGIGKALVVQLLGSVDDIVSPEDNVDLETGKDFVYLDIPNSSHKSVVELDDVQYGEGRKEVIKKALFEEESVLRKESDIPADMMYVQPNQQVTDVVFVIHGIRDEGFWTHKIARKVKKLGRYEGRIFRTETSSYGYFPILSFLTPWVRRAKVAWLMEQYIENSALYPHAAFSFVGHSNGTYLLANALDKFPLIRFKNVVFAGSVVNHRYKWASKIERKQIGKVLNFVASFDWVVAAFPFGLSKWRAKELGGAGHVGFMGITSQKSEDQASQDQEAMKDKIHNFTYVKGTHSAAIKESVWDTIAKFVVNGEVPVKENLDAYVGQQPTISKFVGLISFFIIPFIAIILIIVLILLLYVSCCWPEWIRTLLVLLWGWMVWVIVTRF